MKSLFIAFYKVYPPDTGAAVVSYYAAKYFPGQKYLVFMDNSCYEIRLEGQLALKTFYCSRQNPLPKVWGILRRLPFLVRTIREIKPSWVVLEGASWTGYFVPLLLLLKIRKIKSRLIYHAHNVEAILRKEKNSAFVAWVTGFTEKFVVRNSDIVTAVSHVDIKNFESLYGIVPQFFPNGVDPSQFRVSRSEVDRIGTKYGLEGKIVLFMGLPEYKPNKEAIRFLLDEVFPRLREDWPGVRLAILGGKIENSSPWLINPGSIPFSEVAGFIQNCTVCVAPIFSGSGTRLKILEYMAARKPVVATAKGAEGLKVEDGRNILLAEDAIGFSKKILILLRDSNLRRRVAEKGFQVVNTHYSWPNIIKEFAKKLPATGLMMRGNMMMNSGHKELR